MGYWKERSPGRPYSGKFMVSTWESLKVAKAMRPLSGENHKAELELRISSVGLKNTFLGNCEGKLPLYGLLFVRPLCCAVLMSDTLLSQLTCNDMQSDWNKAARIAITM